MTLEITMSLDGFIAGPNQMVERPLGDGGDRLHEWLFALASWNELHGKPGGAKNADDDDSLARSHAPQVSSREVTGQPGERAVKRRWRGESRK